MPDYRSYDRDPRRGYNERPIRTNSGAVGPKPGISRSSASRAGAPRSSGARPSGSRPAQRPQGQRPAGSRPPQGGRRPAPRRRKRGVQPRFFVILAVLIVLVVALVVILTGGKDKPVVPQNLPTAAPNEGGMGNVTISSATPEPTIPADVAEGNELLSADIADSAEDEAVTDNAPEISVEDQVQLTPEQLKVNTSLPAEWTNVLLLGTDERNPADPARTDTMIIASLNSRTGEVKLTSLLRDVAVKFEDLPKNNGTYRLNAANYFGGPLYAVKTVNELLQMNIEYYVSVNFYGFTKIAEALGGIDVDITEGEMEEINSKQLHQAKAAYLNGIDETGIANELLETYGPNTHLNGRQTLAYARVRYVDNDFTRTERQRTVITKLTEKLRGKSVAEISVLLGSLAGNVTTNMDLNKVLELAMTVLSSDISNIETTRLPENGTYTLDRRNDQEMFYDTDWEKNALTLYNFIYA